MCEIAVHSEAKEVTVYNVIEKHGKKEDGKHLRDEHQELEENLSSLDYTKVRFVVARLSLSS